MRSLATGYSQMKLLPRLVIVLVVCFITMALPAVPAQAICVPYGIELSPKSGVPGTEVIVSGHDFAGDTLVDIYYDGQRIATDRTDRKGDFTIAFAIPEGCRGYYEVEANLGYTRVHTYFTVKPGLTVSPEKGPVGTTVTVAGRGFAKNEEGIELRYYLNDSYETIERNIGADAQGSWETSFQIPPSARGQHKIDAEGAVSKLYEVKEAVFRVTAEISLDKSSGIAGDTITMTGSKFAAYEKDIQILFNGEAVVTGIKASSKGDWEASFKVPEMPAGEYSVTAQGEQTNKEDVGQLSFEIKPQIILSPNEGHVGTDATVTGRGFAANEDVVITYDGSQVATAKTNDKGGFEASFAVPESKYGEHQVTVRFAGGTNSTADLEANASAIFTMESEPPAVPSLLSPAKGSRLGLMSQVTPTFEWSEVFDNSRVCYRLQIATNADFTNSIILKEGLVGTSYTLEEAEALLNGTYYWRVQAVDGAENESGWTAAYSVRVGLLPRWGLIAAIATAAVLFILLIRALIRRRSIYYDRW